KQDSNISSEKQPEARCESRKIQREDRDISVILIVNPRRLLVCPYGPGLEVKQRPGEKYNSR
ncbi:hypothetical protein, partial [Akkermansia sp.]|uniref:hypothetical protein n=1 Tax=Akkermansia sp. TaxID=1872421 RepID=UPI003AB67427